MRSARPLRYSIVSATLAAALLGCATTAPREDGIDSETGIFAPAIQGAQDGLEVQWWVVRGGLHQLADLPAAALTPPLDPQTAALWADHGLRILNVPLDQLPDLQRRLGVAEGTSGLGVQRQWLGQCPMWSPIVEGPALGPTGVWMESGPLALPAGRLRLLGRAWTEPALDSANGCRPLLRIELAPQHAERAAPDPLGLDQPTAREPVDEGLVFRRLAMTLKLEAGHAIVIVPERPGLTWGEPEEPPAPGPPSPGDSAEPNLAPFGHIVREDQNPAPREPAQDDVQIGAAGPRAPRLPTLGEAMLMSARPGADAASPPAGRGPVRAVVVLIPRLPEEFRLLPH